jgi:hypothetical protein
MPRRSGLRSGGRVRLVLSSDARWAGRIQAPPLHGPVCSAESARDMVVVGRRRGPGRADLQGASGSSGRHLGSCGLFVEARAAGTEGSCATGFGVAVGERYGFLLFGSPQRCSPIRAAQSNWGLLLTRSASRVRSRSPCSSRLRVGILLAQQKPKDVRLRNGLSRIRRAALCKGVVRAAAECTAGRAESHRRARAGRPPRATSPR